MGAPGEGKELFSKLQKLQRVWWQRLKLFVEGFDEFPMF